MSGYRLKEYSKTALLLLCGREIFRLLRFFEAVYAPIYRDYDGDFVFDIEKNWQYTIAFADITLFVLVDEPKNLIDRDDGKSFSVDIETKKEEIESFKRAFDLSCIKRKHFININNKTIDDVHKIITGILFGSEMENC